jgi:hypothetical protein
MEEGEFSEARENLDALEEDYRSAYDMGDDADQEPAEFLQCSPGLLHDVCLISINSIIDFNFEQIVHLDLSSYS